MTLAVAALYAVVEGNKKCKSKRVGVEEREKKIRGEKSGRRVRAVGKKKEKGRE